MPSAGRQVGLLLVELVPSWAAPGLLRLSCGCVDAHPREQAKKQPCLGTVPVCLPAMAPDSTPLPHLSISSRTCEGGITVPMPGLP